MANNRFVNNTLSELEEANRIPICDYEDVPILTLEETIEKIVQLVPGIVEYVSVAKESCNRNSTLLNWNESAAIYLYSMPKPFFSRLNTTLRAENRHKLKPWFAFLKLFITAIKKLPSTKATIWRGVNYDDTLSFVDNDVHVWWSINSCSMNPNSVQPFLGESGTLFVIDAIHAKDICTFSAIPDEQEVILMPGTRVRRRYESLNFIDRLFVVHLEEINPQSKSQSESSYLFEQIRQEYQRNNRLQRIMNPSKSFPIEQSYINLAIVKAKDQHEKEKQLRDVQDSDTIMNTFEEIYGMKTVIDIKNIFETCKNQEKQVLVFGRAGIGKSTFCRYVAYQWATGSYWSQYELLALIPLRRLTIDLYPPLPLGQNYSLIDLVKKEVFPYDLSETEENVLKQQFDAKKTLWILDGYDEIVYNVPPHLKRLFEQLLKTPHHILTSRPYLNTLSYDVQMEITGFTDDNIVEYVEQFFNQMKSEVDDATINSENLLKFLKPNRSIWGIAHIPVHLELICSLWSNKDLSEIEELTITTLYTMMTEWLCRRYLTAQNNRTQNLSTDQVYQRCQKELAFLETLAFSAMKSNTIIIKPSLLKQALNEAKVSLEENPHILNIGILKSFNKQGTGTQIEPSKDHYFVHLSFQEYFAARYLINALKGSSIEKTIEFIKYQKYNQRYALVFTFASGLLSDVEEKSATNVFWHAIQKEPLDLVGIRHLQLTILCMEETYGKPTLLQHNELLERITKCIQYSFDNDKKFIREHLRHSLERAQSVVCHPTIIKMLIDLLQNDDMNRKLEVLSFISQLKISNPSAGLITSITTSVNDKNERVRVNAWHALGEMGEKAATDEVISKLLSALGDDSTDVRQYACQAVVNMGEKAATNEMISKLVSALGDKSEWVRQYVCEALGKMGKKAAMNEVISKLVTALGDESKWVVRENACEALRKMGEKAATNEVISRLVSALGDESEWVRRYACKALWKMGEKAATNEVISRLVSALGDESEWVRRYACEALGQMGEKAVKNEVINKLLSALENKSVDVRQHACKALGKMGEKAANNKVISKLVCILGDKSGFVSRYACEALGEMGEKAATNEVISKLVSALENKSVDVRQHACKALGMMGEKAATNEAISKLVSALGDVSVDVREYACKALGKMGEKAATNEVINKLVTALGDKSAFVRQDACKTLGMMGEKAATNEVTNTLVTALGDDSVDVRGYACEALVNMGLKGATNKVICKLMSALGDKSVFVSRYACKALGKMGEKAATNEVISKLASALGDESALVRRYACEALGEMGEKAATNEVISKLVSALEDKSVDVRQHACKALGQMGEKAATIEVINKLVSALGDESKWVRVTACKVLEKISEKTATNEVINKLLSALGDESKWVRENACKVLGKMSEKIATNEVTNKLVAALEDESVDVRGYACEALVNMDKKAATNEVISKLISALGDESDWVRQYACGALGKMGEKAATNEVMNKLIVLMDSNHWSLALKAANAIGKIFSSSVSIEQLDSQVISKIYQSKHGLDCLKNVSADQLVKRFFTSKSRDWLSEVTRFTLLQGAAVIVTIDKVVVYGRKEPVELCIPSLELRQQVVEGFIDQAKRLHLSYGMASEVGNES